VSINPEEERRECSGVNDPQTIGLAGLEREGRIFVEADGGGDRSRRRSRNRRKVFAVLSVIHQSGICRERGKKV
jgi:hypothetical protein